MARIVVLSDIHLSPTHGFFWKNWRTARDFANSQGAEAVIVNGDLCINGPDSDDEIEFAAQALRKLDGPVLALPGNHDIGDEPPGQDPEQLVTPERLARWKRFLGTDRWTIEADNWRLIGVNAQLFGSGLVDEAEQSEWLDEELGAAKERPVALFLHKPLFVESPKDQEESAACLTPAARAGLSKKLSAAGVRLVVSGHLHQSLDRTIDGVRYYWLPAVAFATPELRGGGGAADCGLTIFEFSGNHVEIRIERPVGLISHDLTAIKGHGKYAFLRDMPPCPPPAEPWARHDVVAGRRPGNPFRCAIHPSRSWIESPGRQPSASPEDGKRKLCSG
jgi:predicted phosphodiesterase